MIFRKFTQFKSGHFKTIYPQIRSIKVWTVFNCKSKTFVAFQLSYSRINPFFHFIYADVIEIPFYILFIHILKSRTTFQIKYTKKNLELFFEYILKMSLVPFKFKNFYTCVYYKLFTDYSRKDSLTLSIHKYLS